MMRKDEQKYLFDMIRYSILGGECPQPQGVPDWARLYALCKRHLIDGMVGYGVEKLPAKWQPEEKIRKRFGDAIKRGIAKEAAQQFSLEEVLQAFEKEKVDCLPLKGILLKQFYPNPQMREMADLDILYRARDEETVGRILLEKGYVCDHKDGHHDVYFRKPFINIEMHHTLPDGDKKMAAYYKNVWDRLSKEEGKEHIYRFSWEDYYVFMIVHLKKHCINGGSGIRSIVDIWRFMDRMEKELDWKYLDGELEKTGLARFEKHMRKLAAIWFEGEESTAFYEELGDYIIGSGVYGTTENHNANRVVVASKGRSMAYGKLKIRMGMIFLPLSAMKIMYPYLRRFPWLLPAAWVQRIFRTVFKKKGRASEVLGSVDVESSKADRRRELFEKAGM